MAAGRDIGIIGGGQIGANYQFSTWVVGVEGTFSGTNTSGSGRVTNTALTTNSFTSAPQWLATVTGRIGYADNDWLFYGKFGGAIMHTEYTETILGAGGAASGASELDDNRTGFVAGAGIVNWQSYYGQNKIDQWMIPFFGASVYQDPAVYARSSPITFITHSQTPVLILQGERDYQVTMKDFDLWKTGLAGRAGVTMRSFPALNHLFLAGEGKSTPKEYEQPGHVAAEVVDAIASWIAAGSPAAVR